MRFYINDIDSKLVDKLLRKVLNSDDDVIAIHINTDGGCFQSALNIYDILRSCGKKIITHASNSVYSAGMIIYMAGDLRYTNNQAHFMIHEVRYDTAADTTVCTLEFYKQQVKELERDTKHMLKLISERSNLTLKYINEKFNESPNREWYFGADEAMSTGIAHRIGLPLWLSSETHGDEVDD